MVVAVDDQSDIRVDVRRWAALASAVLEAEGVIPDAEMSLVFVDETEMAHLNGEFMGVDGPTDVLAFPIDGPEPGESVTLVGDVAICPTIAIGNAPEHAGTVEDELALLVVHGVLHLLGHDHGEFEEAARMRARELVLLETLHWRGPAPGTFRSAQP